MMIWKRMILVAILLGITVLVLSRLRVYYIRDGAVGDLIWNENESYVFVKVFRYGYSFSYLGYLGEVAREVFPFGASLPEKKHYYAVVLHITAEEIKRYSFDNFDVGDVFAVGKIISAGSFLDKPGPTKWSGTHFEPMSAEEEKELRDGARVIPPGPRYDNIVGWSKRKLDVVSPTEEDAKITIEIAGKQLALIAHSGARDHEAYIDVTRPGHPPDRAWQLNEGSQRVSKATYKQIFGDN